MNYFLITKKENRVYVWLAVDRNRNQIIDFEVSTARDFNTYFTISLRAEQRYKAQILTTDGYDVYGKYSIATRHIITKSETDLMESKNSLVRHYLARFHRKTKRYSKALNMITNSFLCDLYTLLQQECKTKYYLTVKILIHRDYYNNSNLGI